MHGQISFFDDRVWPSPFHQDRLGNDLSVSLEQCLEEGEASVANSHGLAAPLQQTAADIQDKRAEDMLRLHHVGNICDYKTFGNRAIEAEAVVESILYPSEVFTPLVDHLNPSPRR